MLSLGESFILVVCNWHFALEIDCELKIPKDTTWVGKEFSRTYSHSQVEHSCFHCVHNMDLIHLHRRRYRRYKMLLKNM